MDQEFSALAEKAGGDFFGAAYYIEGSRRMRDIDFFFPSVLEAERFLGTLSLSGLKDLILTAHTDSFDDEEKADG